jgi:hypothetical protein
VRTPAELDAHVADPTIHRRQFRQWVQFDAPITNSRKMIGRAHKALTLTELDSIIRGTLSPSVTWELRWAVDLGGVVTTAVLAGITTTDTGTGHVLTTFDSSAIPAGAWVWVICTAVSGTVTEVAMTLVLEETGS